MWYLSRTLVPCKHPKPQPSLTWASYVLSHNLGASFAFRASTPASTDRLRPLAQETLVALLYKDSRFQFSRLESLLSQASRAPGRSELSRADADGVRQGSGLELLLSPGVAFVRPRTGFANYQSVGQTSPTLALGMLMSAIFGVIRRCALLTRVTFFRNAGRFETCCWRSWLRVSTPLGGWPSTTPWLHRASACGRPLPCAPI